MVLFAFYTILIQCPAKNSFDLRTNFQAAHQSYSGGNIAAQVEWDHLSTVVSLKQIFMR